MAQDCSCLFQSRRLLPSATLFNIQWPTQRRLGLIRQSHNRIDGFAMVICDSTANVSFLAHVHSFLRGGAQRALPHAHVAGDSGRRTSDAWFDLRALAQRGTEVRPSMPIYGELRELNIKWPTACPCPNTTYACTQRVSQLRRNVAWTPVDTLPVRQSRIRILGHCSLRILRARMFISLVAKAPSTQGCGHSDTAGTSAGVWAPSVCR